MKLEETRNIVFSDLDGTLLDEEGIIKYEMLKYIKTMAVDRYAVTGRSKLSLLNIKDYDQLAEFFSAPMLCYNGNALWNQDCMRLEIRKGILAAKSLTDQLIEHKIDFVVDVGDKIYATSSSSALRYSIFNEIPRKLIRIGLEDICINTIALLFHLYCGQNELPFIQNLFGENEVRYDFWPMYLVIYPSGTDKINGIRFLLENRSDLKTKIITLGNDDNDIEMTKFADMGIAVEGSTLQLYQHAGFILVQKEGGIYAKRK